MARFLILVVLLATMMATMAQDSCTSEISQRPINHCRWWLQSIGRSDQSRQCCTELTAIRTPCRCEALRRNYIQVAQRYMGSEELLQRVRTMAQNIPRDCGSPECRLVTGEHRHGGMHYDGRHTQELQGGCEREISHRTMNQCRWWLGSLGASAQTGQCCGELSGISAPCRCEAIRSNYMQASEGYMGSDQLMHRVRGMAQAIPGICGWQSPTQCRVA